jgi:hypothetical protein
MGAPSGAPIFRSYGDSVRRYLANGSVNQKRDPRPSRPDS